MKSSSLRGSLYLKLHYVTYRSFSQFLVLSQKSNLTFSICVRLVYLMIILWFSTILSTLHFRRYIFVVTVILSFVSPCRPRIDFDYAPKTNDLFDLFEFAFHSIHCQDYRNEKNLLFHWLIFFLQKAIIIICSMQKHFDLYYFSENICLFASNC